MARETEPSSSSQNSSEPRGLLYILLSVFAFFSGWSSAKLSAPTPDQDVSKTVHPQDTPTPENRQREIGSSVVSQVPPAPPQQHQSERRKDNTPLWEKAAAITIAAGTLGLFVINILLWCATQKAADAAKNAADTSKAVFKLTYRPRLRLAGINPIVQTMVNGKLHTELDKGRLRVSIDVPNMGPFPARNVRFFRYDTVTPRDQIAKRPYQTELLGEPKTIYPKVEGGSSGMAITGQKVISPEDLEGLKVGTLWATFSILIVYDDDFGDTHHTEYCDIFTLQPYNDICPWPVQND